MRYLAMIIGAGALCVSAAAEAQNLRNMRHGGKLLLTDGVTSVDGAAGGGLASWAVIGGHSTNAGLGAGAHATYVHTGDFDLTAFGAKIGLFDRLELSVARQSFDTRAAGAALGLGEGFTFGQDIFGAKLRLAGNVALDQHSILPQIAIGVQHKRADEGAVIRAVGGARDSDTDLYIAATKVLLGEGLVLNATARRTRANQFGLLGFGGDRAGGHSIQFEGSAGLLVTRRLVIGGEFRTKPDNLGFAAEEDALDLFAAWALHRNLSLTAAYVDLGSIATLDKQRGVYLSLQTAF